MPQKRHKRKNISELSVDEFMGGSFDDGNNDNEALTSATRSGIGNKRIKRQQKQDDQPSKSQHVRHKSLEKLKNADPEFYKFLESEDKNLLEFSDEEDDEIDENDDENVEAKNESDENDEDAEVDKIVNELEGSESDEEGPIHKPPQKLEEYEIPREDSDESEEEGMKDDVDDGKQDVSKAEQDIVPGRLTLNMIKRWTRLLQEKPTASLLHDVVQSFKLSVARVTNTTDNSARSVDDSSVLNALMRLCLDHMLGAILTLLRLANKTVKLDRPSLVTQSKGWKRIRVDVKSYLGDLLKVLTEITQSITVDVILKHVLTMTTFFASFPAMSRNLLKRLVKHWSEGVDTTRVVAFLCINRLVRTNTDTLLDSTIKKMYMAYVRNCKFTSPSTLPVINFMQRTLVEIFSLVPAVTYQYAFIYIRQLAIHLRNAIVNHKAEEIAAVYNWQYAHSTQLWVRVLCALCPGDCLDPLIYPLTQTIIGVIKLVPTQKFYPLRFHCVRSLTLLASSVNVFIPILPFIVEVFEQTDFNRRHKNISIHPINFTTILKLSKSQITEKAFKDGVIDQLYELLLDYFNVYSHEIGFPELILPALIQLKDFVKKCKVANYCKQMKQVIEKVQESSQMIVERRKNVTFTVADTQAIEDWQNRVKAEGTPISKYYSTWRGLRDRELQHEISGKDRLLDNMDIPKVDRSKFKQKATEEDRKEFAALFEGESDEDGDEQRFMLKEERTKKVAKATKKTTVDSEDSDQYSELDSDEMEQLAGSADENEDKGEGSAVEDDEDDDEENDEDDGDDDDDDGGGGGDKEDVVEDLELSSDEDD